MLNMPGHAEHPLCVKRSGNPSAILRTIDFMAKNMESCVCSGRCDHALCSGRAAGAGERLRHWAALCAAHLLP